MEKSWYSAGVDSGQGLIADESDGRTVAVAYKGEDALLLATAPALAESLRFLVDAARTEPGMATYKAHIQQAESLLQEVGE